MSQERIEIRKRSRADWNTMNNKSPKTWKSQIIPSFCNSPHILHHCHYLCLDDVVEVWGEGPGQPQDVSVLPLGVSQALDLGLQLQVHGPVGFACDESRKITCSNKLADAETILLLMMTDLKDGQLSYFFIFFRTISTLGHILRLTTFLRIWNFSLQHAKIFENVDRSIHFEMWNQFFESETV